MSGVGNLSHFKKMCLKSIILMEAYFTFSEKHEFPFLLEKTDIKQKTVVIQGTVNTHVFSS